MALKEDPLEDLFYFQVIDWFQSKILIHRVVCGCIFLFVACMVPLSLYSVREDRDQLFLNLMAELAFAPAFMSVIIYPFTTVRYIELRKKADEKFRSILSEDLETYDRIIRSSRKVAVGLWFHLASCLFLPYTVTFYKKINSQLSINDLMARSRVFEGLTAAFVLCLWMFVFNLISLQARWSHYIWVQMVLLESNISRKLGIRINRNDTKEQELCRRRLKEVVKFHSDIKSVANDFFNNASKVNAILMFLPTVCLFTSTAILIFFTDQHISVKLVICTVIFATIFGLYVAVRNCQSTIDQSEKLCKVLYECPWYDWDKRNCTTLSIIMSVVKKPLLKTEMFGILDVNYTVFLKMFRLSYGLITAILNLK